MQDVASVIEKDPVLAAQVLKLCNSAALATREPCKSISQAVTRLGSKNLRSVLLECPPGAFSSRVTPKSRRL